MLETTKELDESCVVGQHVKWTTMDGTEHTGVLCEWDNGTAIVMKDGVGASGTRKVAVRE